MFTRMDQTIGELENMVARRQGFPDFDRSDFPSPWLLDLLFRLPNHSTSAASMVPFEGAWITVWAKGPQPDAFSRSGLVMSSVVNPSGGKGTKSITAEFHNAFLEVMWSDPASADPFARQPKYRTQRQSEGWRRGAGPTAMDIETLPADDVIHRPAVFVSASTLAMDRAVDARRGRAIAPSLLHPLGIRRVTAVRLVPGSPFEALGPLEYVEKSVMYGLRSGNGWAVEITFDGGAKGETQDLRPSLPIVVRY